MGWEGEEDDGQAHYATYANVSRVPSTRSMYSFSSKWSIACWMRDATRPLG